MLGVGPTRKQELSLSHNGGLFRRVKNVVQGPGTLKEATVGLGCQWRGSHLPLPVPHPALSSELEEVWELRV